MSRLTKVNREKSGHELERGRNVSQKNEETVWKQAAEMWLYRHETVVIPIRGRWIPRDKFTCCAKAKAERKLQLDELFRGVLVSKYFIS